MNTLVIGTRGSSLALAQTNMVRDWIQKHNPDLAIRLQIIKTSGDRISELPLAQVATETKGLFVKEIEEALLAQTIDLAVHSLKDLPGVLPEGLRVGAFPVREDPRDVIVTRLPMQTLDQLPRGALLGTGSLRRSVQLKRLRPDLDLQNIRGNVDTRIRKMEEQNLDGVVLAAAGLKRMKLEKHIRITLSVDQMIPAAGQGALALEIRAEDQAAAEWIAPLDCFATRLCVEAERLFLNRMGGGCRMPMGAHASLCRGKAEFRAFVAEGETGQILRESWAGKPEELSAIAEHTARKFMQKGALRFLEEKA